MPNRPSVNVLCQVSGRPTMQLRLWKYLKHSIDNFCDRKLSSCEWSCKKSCPGGQTAAVQLSPLTPPDAAGHVQGQALEERQLHLKSLCRLECSTQQFYSCSWRETLSKVPLLRLTWTRWVCSNDSYTGRPRSLISSEYLFASWWILRMNRLWGAKSLAQAEWVEEKGYC